MCFHSKVKWKNIKKISKRDIVCWIFLTLFLIELFIEAFLIPKYHVLNPIYEKHLAIERIYLDSYRKRVVLYADGEEYYMGYSSLYASESIRKIRKDLENGTLAVGDTATIQFISADDIRFNFILQKKRIVDLRTENEIYYTLDTEKTILMEHKIGAIILFFVFLLVWSLFTYLSLITDNILVFRPSKKRDTHKKYKKSK
ncbi:MAG: hypothetical protein IKW18_07285 [Clostridia bacterium]|nr:hypothetical protein [Clostridia bacterium]